MEEALVRFLVLVMRCLVNVTGVLLNVVLLCKINAKFVFGEVLHSQDNSRPWGEPRTSRGLGVGMVCRRSSFSVHEKPLEMCTLLEEMSTSFCVFQWRELFVGTVRNYFSNVD